MKAQYDVIIIGSGLGGLSAAASLSKAGKSVLVLEQYSRAGGFGQSYTIGDYSFDTAVHAIWFWDELDAILKEDFNIALPVVPARRGDHIIFNDTCDFYATSIPEMQAQLQKIIPQEADGIASYYRMLMDAQDAFVRYSNDTGNADARRALARHGEVWKITLEEAIKKHVKDPLAVNLLMGYHDAYLYDYSWSFPAHHLYMTKYLYDGYHPIGGSQPLVDKLVQAIQAYGGDVLTDCLVTKICVENGRASGVRVNGERTVTAREAVISNGDGMVTLEKLIGVEAMPEPMQREYQLWKNQIPSLSYYILNVGIDIDVKEVYGLKGDLTVYYPSNDILGCFKNINQGQLPDDFWLWAVFPSVNDATLAPQGHSVGVLSVLVPYSCEDETDCHPDYQFDGLRAKGKKGDAYYVRKAEITQRILNRADEVFPGLSAHITVQDLITPQTIEWTTLNHKGSTLGFTVTPELQRKSSRYVGLRHKTAIDGLYFCGGWTEGGFSAPAVINSGREVAFQILGQRGKLVGVDPDHRLERLRAKVGV